MQIITSRKTYATVENAIAALDRALAKFSSTRDEVRWFVGVAEDGKRYVPCVCGERYVQLAHHGIMVVG